MAEKKKKAQKKKKITPRQRKFIDLFINSGNATQSFIKAGFKDKEPGVAAYRLLKKPHIQQEVDRRRLEIGEQSNITSQMVLNEIAKLAFSNSEDFFEWGKQQVELAEGIMIERGVAILKLPEELTRDHKACIQSIEETQHGIKLKLYSKDKALESLKKYFGMDNEAEIKKAFGLDGKSKESIEETKLPADLSTPEKVKEASTAILKSVSTGKITPSVGASMIGLLDSHRKTLETVDLEKRIEELEDRSE